MCCKTLTQNWSEATPGMDPAFDNLIWQNQENV
jgi:hypothetical protein